MSGKGGSARPHIEAGAKPCAVKQRRGRKRSELPGMVLFQLLAEGLGLVIILDVLFYREYLALPFLLALLPFYIRLRLDGRREAQKRQQLRDFREVLDSLSISLRAGYSVENAIPETVVMLKKTLGEHNEMTNAWEKIAQQMTLKAPADGLILEFAKGCQADEIRSFAAVFTAAKRMGGNLGRIVADAAETISRKIEVEEEIQTMLAAKRLEQRIMAVMPLGIILYMNLTSPDYLAPLYHSLLGAGIMTVCLAVWCATLLWGRRIVRIEV